jgi:O-antigen ligase
MLRVAILFCYCLFAFGSTFSIALAQTTLGISAVLFVAFCVTSRYNPFSGQLKMFYCAIGALVGWKILTALVSSNPLSSLNAMREEWLFLAVPIGVWLMQSANYRRYILSTLLTGVVLMSLYAFFQNATGFEHHGNALAPAPDFGFRVIGTFPHELTFGNYYAVVAMTFLGAGLVAFRNSPSMWRLILLGASLMAAMASGLSYSRGSLIAMAPAVVVGGWLLIRYHARWVAVAVIVIAAGFIYTHPGLLYRMSTEIVKDQTADNVMSRQFIWTHSLQVVGDNLLFGTGPGQFKEAYATTLTEGTIERGHHSHAHNDLLTIAAESGLIGAGLFAFLWLTLIRHTIKGIKSVPSVEQMLPVGALFGIGAFLVTGLTEATFFDEEVRQMLMLVWAFGLWPLGIAPATDPDLSGKSS